MSILFNFFVWMTLQLGLPICDIDPNNEECRTLEQISKEDNTQHYGSSTPDMRKTWKIYNGF